MQHHPSLLTWIRLCLSQSFLLLSPSHGCFYLRYHQHNSFTFSYKDSPHGSPHMARSSFRTYPSFVSSRALFAVSQPKHRIWSSLSYQTTYPFFKVHPFIHNSNSTRSNRHFHEQSVNDCQLILPSVKHQTLVQGRA